MLKISFSGDRKAVRVRYIVLIAVYLILLGALFIYYTDLSHKTFEKRGSVMDLNDPGVSVEGTRSKEWRESPTAPFSKGMEYDFIITNPDKNEIYDWRTEIQFSSDFDIDSAWNGSYEKVDRTLVIVPDEVTSIVDPGKEKTFGLVMLADDEQAAGDYRLLYKINAKMTGSPLFWLLMVALVFTSATFLADELNYLRYERLRKKQEEISGILQESFETFAHIIDAKDPYTEGHSLRVAYYAKLIAAEMGYDEDEQERVYRIGMLHDIGKIGVTDLILQKPGKLDNDEYSLIQTHVDIGGEILKDFNGLKGISEGAKYHHERWDGKGYSSHLSGKNIPEIARIICVADSYDAMTSPRVYRGAMSGDFARQELINCSGTQFDPEIVRIMVKLIDLGKVPVEL